MSRRVSVLDGPHAHEWAKYCPQLGVQLGVAQVAAQELRKSSGVEHHFCGCGRVQALCAECDVWVCNAPGHLKHVCRGGI